MLWCAFTLAFYGFLRCGEFVAPGINTHDTSQHLTWSDLSCSHSSLQVTIKSSKTDPFRKGCTLSLPAIQRASLFTGLVDWTGLDWTGLEWTGLTQKSVKCLFQCRTEAKHTYPFTKVACIACFRVFLRVGRGQRSHAYLTL